MRSYSIITCTLVLFVICLLIPNGSSQSESISDTTFIPNFNWGKLSGKRHQLSERIDEILNKKGPACSNYSLELCHNKTKELEQLRVSDSIKAQIIIDQALKYKVMWETTCQSWKIEKEQLENQTSQQKGKLIEDSLLIKSQSDEISELTGRLKNCRAECPNCPDGGKQRDDPQPTPPIDCSQCPQHKCPSPVPCDCPVHPQEDCQEHIDSYTLIFRKYEQLEEEYRSLHGKLRQCEEDLVAARAGSSPDESGSDCKHINEIVTGKVKNILSQMKTTIEGGKFGQKTQSYLNQLMKEAERQTSQSTEAENVTSVIHPLLKSFTDELKRLDNSVSRGRDLLKECSTNYDIQTKRLLECENNVAPFIKQ